MNSAGNVLIRAGINTKSLQKAMNQSLARYNLAARIAGHGNLSLPYLLDKETEYLIYLLRFDDIFEGYAFMESEEDNEKRVLLRAENVIGEIISNAPKTKKTIVVMPTMDSLKRQPIIHSYQAKILSIILKVQILFLDRLTAACPNVVPIHLNILIPHGPRNDFRNWYWNRVPYSIDSLQSIASVLSTIIISFQAPPRKLIVTDLDNTLWHGILGEDGISGIKVGPEDAVGEPFFDFQRNLRMLKDVGYLLAISSKNNLSEVQQAFNQRSDMPLRWEDFVCTRINWDEKNLSIKSIASELNLSLDSVVFIDDSPIERKKILELLPEVTVLPLEVSPVLRPSQILDFVELWKSELTLEDFSRTHQYSLEVSRKNLIEREDREENSWLEDLDIFIEINELNEMNVIRASQLANKTNQMNLATRRLSEKDLLDIRNQGDSRVLCVKASDSFGEYGMIGLVVLEIDEHKLVVKDFLLSCRVLGRFIEHKVLREILIRFSSPEQFVEFNYSRTEKNFPILMFLQEIGAMLNDKCIVSHLLEKLPRLETIELSWQ